MGSIPTLLLGQGPTALARGSLACPPSFRKYKSHRPLVLLQPRPQTTSPAGVAGGWDTSQSSGPLPLLQARGGGYPTCSRSRVTYKQRKRLHCWEEAGRVVLDTFLRLPLDINSHPSPGPSDRGPGPRGGEGPACRAPPIRPPAACPGRTRSTGMGVRGARGPGTSPEGILTVGCE